MNLEQYDKTMMSKGYRYRMQFESGPPPLYTKTMQAACELLKDYPESKHGPIKIRFLFSIPEVSE